LDWAQHQQQQHCWKARTTHRQPHGVQVTFLLLFKHFHPFAEVWQSGWSGTLRERSIYCCKCLTNTQKGRTSGFTARTGECTGATGWCGHCLFI